MCVGGLVYRLVERTVCLNSAASPLKKDKTGSLASSRNRSLGIIRDVVLRRLKKKHLYRPRSSYLTLGTKGGTLHLTCILDFASICISEKYDVHCTNKVVQTCIEWVIRGDFGRFDTLMGEGGQTGCDD